MLPDLQPDTVFRLHWLPAALDAATFARVRDMPLALLRDLYEPVWAYGPNAFLLQRRLANIATALNENRMPSIAHNFLHTYADLNPRSQLMARDDHTLADICRAEGRANNYWAENLLREHSQLSTLAQHPTWSTSNHYTPHTRNRALTAFVTHTLLADLLPAVGYDDYHWQRHVHFVHRHGLDTTDDSN